MPFTVRQLGPLSLTALRLLMAPLALWNAHSHGPGWIFVICLIVAVISDIYDGIWARRLGVDTPALRRFDSLTDLIFYLSILFCAYTLHADLLRPFVWVIVLVLLLDITCHTTSFIRFSRPASTHCWSAKIWGLLLFAAFTALLGFGVAGLLLWVTIIAGIVAELESLAVILVADQWPRDVPSFLHLLKRKNLAVVK